MISKKNTVTLKQEISLYDADLNFYSSAGKNKDFRENARKHKNLKCQMSKLINNLLVVLLGV